IRYSGSAAASLGQMSRKKNLTASALGYQFMLLAKTRCRGCGITALEERKNSTSTPLSTTLIEAPGATSVRRSASRSETTRLVATERQTLFSILLSFRASREK